MPKTHNKIHSNVIDKSLEVIKEISPEQYDYCQKFIENFVNAVKTDETLRKKLGFSEIQAKSMTDAPGNQHLWALPENSLGAKVAKSVVSPAQTIFRWGKELFLDNEFGKEHFHSVYQGIQDNKNHEKIIADYKNVLGLFNSVEKWENANRQRFGFDKIKAGEKFLMSDEDLQKSLQKRSFDAIDPTKGQYSVKNLSTGIRVVSGLIGAWFYGMDAYNTTMKLSNDSKQSKKEGRMKFLQQIVRISLASYFTATALGVFKKQTNKSMGFALTVTAGTALASEILGRVSVGNPVLPTTKRKLEERQIQNQNSNNPVLKFGNLIAGKSCPAPQIKNPQKINITTEYSQNRTKFAGTRKLSQNKHQVSFQGLPMKYKKDELNSLLKLVETLDPGLAEYYKKNIVKSLVHKKLLSKDAIYKPFDNVIGKFSEIEIGTTTTRGEKIQKAVLAPFYWAKGSLEKMGKSVEGAFAKDSKTEHQTNLEKIKEMGLSRDYEESLVEFKKTDVFRQQSKLTDDKKIEAFTQSFVHVNGVGFEDELQGIQNSFEWLKKNISRDKKSSQDPFAAIRDVLANKNNPDVKKHLQKLNDDMNKKSFVAYAKDFADYDTSKYAVINNALVRVLSATFLVFDAYNLTMLHSNDKQKSMNNGAQYATQEATRTVMSSYIINATNTVFQSLYNSSLAGALSLVGLSSLIVSSVSRLAVGNPILPKNQKQLLEQDEKNKNNPMLKITSRMVGRSLKKMDYGKKSDVK